MRAGRGGECASADITQPQLSITGDITLGANAFNGAAEKAMPGPSPIWI